MQDAHVLYPPRCPRPARWTCLMRCRGAACAGFGTPAPAAHDVNQSPGATRQGETRGGAHQVLGVDGGRLRVYGVAVRCSALIVAHWHEQPHVGERCSPSPVYVQ